MEMSGNSVESAVRYTAWWCAMIGGNIGPQRENGEVAGSARRR
jgi:hypothetical protein